MSELKESYDSFNYTVSGRDLWSSKLEKEFENGQSYLTMGYREWAFDPATMSWNCEDDEEHIHYFTEDHLSHCWKEKDLRKEKKDEWEEEQAKINVL
jgi:hypothetical protein